MVALSSVEAGFRGIAKGITKILWLRKSMKALGFSQTKACQLYCDKKQQLAFPKIRFSMI